MSSEQPKKKLTLKLVKKDAQAPVEKGKSTEPKVAKRAAVFVVPEDQKQRSFRPSTGGFEENKKRDLTFLKDTQKAKSNVVVNKPSSGYVDRRPERPQQKRKVHRSSLHQHNNRSSKWNVGMGVVQNLSGEINVECEQTWRRAKAGKKPSPFDVKPTVIKTVNIHDNIEVQALATGMAVNIKDLTRKLKQIGAPHKPHDTLDIDTAELIVMECGHNVKKIIIKDVDDDPVADFEGDAKPRPPIVTIVGHVDHGKTSLLDAIRKTNVTAEEAGGITQSIGAYQVESGKGQTITFLDTPGHETFTSMRARGVQVTDIVILVVAADDGIKDQTVEAIKHIKDSDAQLIVAVTKVDKPTANVDKVLESLLQHDIVTEKFSGHVVAVPVSSITGEGIDKLLDAIALQAEIMELKARTEGHGIGVVLETAMKKGLGHVANVLVQKGTLKLGDFIVVGKVFGKVKCLIDHLGNYVKNAGPSVPVSVVGLASAPEPADRLTVTPNEALAKSTAQARADKPVATERSVVTLEDLYAQTDEGKILFVVLKADTMGSLEALRQGVENVRNEEVTIKVVGSSVGVITESDVTLAQTAKAIIVGFNVQTPASIMKFATGKFVHIISEKIIYRLLEMLQNTIDAMMKPVIEANVIGKAEVIKLFTFSKGTVAGSKVLDGKIQLNAKIRVVRKDEIVADGVVKSLQRETQSIKEASKGQECGIMLDNFHDYQLGDVLECYEEVEKSK